MFSETSAIRAQERRLFPSTSIPRMAARSAIDRRFMSLKVHLQLSFVKHKVQFEVYAQVPRRVNIADNDLLSIIILDLLAFWREARGIDL